MRTRLRLVAGVDADKSPKRPNLCPIVSLGAPFFAYAEGPRRLLRRFPRPHARPGRHRLSVLRAAGVSAWVVSSKVTSGGSGWGARFANGAARFRARFPPACHTTNCPRRRHAAEMRSVRMRGHPVHYGQHLLPVFAT